MGLAVSTLRGNEDDVIRSVFKYDMCFITWNIYLFEIFSGIFAYTNHKQPIISWQNGPFGFHGSAL